MNETSLSLDEIGLETGTDKSSAHHNYLSLYERFFERFRDKPIKILEIGILDGASVKMWERYFHNGIIIGADINPNVRRFETTRTKIEVIDQSNIQNLVDLAIKYGPFDIIIEDGSHFWEHQITSLKVLFPFLKDFGFYVVEDLQTNFATMADSFQGISTISCIEYLKKLVDLRVATACIDITKEEDPFLRTYGRSVGFIAFCKHACIIEKIMEKQVLSHLVRKSSLEVVKAGIYPFQIFAHVGFLGDVLDNGLASLSIQSTEDNYIQGVGFSCSEEIQGQIKYRGRQGDCLWTEWVSGNEFAGSRGNGLALTGFSVEISGHFGNLYDVFTVGLFSGSDNLVRVGNGEDCVPKQNGTYLCGVQLILQPKTSYR